jgi:16S rRNA (cytosine967-C5)-methyltransferase
LIAEQTPSPKDADIPGLAVRRLAAQALIEVLRRNRPLDEALDGRQALAGIGALPERDRALLRMIVATALRRLGSIRALLDRALERGLPDDSPSIEAALIVGATQILFLAVPHHAAVDLAVRLAKREQQGRYAGLVNAVLRRLAREGAHALSSFDASTDAPSWLFERWSRTYGAETARAIALAHRTEPPLDLSVKRDPQAWATRLAGRALAPATVRLVEHGPVAALPGYTDGQWWVQDYAASLPARLLGDVRDKRVADLCAAPGGKAAQLAAAGARVTAVDRSPARLSRLRENLARLKLEAEIVEADAAAFGAEPFDAVLLDAPCTSTGTIRRHPDLPWRRRPDELLALVALQTRLLDRAAELVRPGGLLVYATCSLEPEEGEEQIAALLARRSDLARVPLVADDVAGHAEMVNAQGDLRSLPCNMPDAEPRWAGCDGFYAARLRKSLQ